MGIYQALSLQYGFVEEGTGTLGAAGAVGLV